MQSPVRMSSSNTPCPSSAQTPQVTQAGDQDPLSLRGKHRGSQLSTRFLFPQTSLSKLLEALGKAEPFFIRCIRSNAEKVRGAVISGR